MAHRLHAVSEAVRRRGTASIPPVEALHVFVLVGFAVTQPLLDLLRRNIAFFIARRSLPIDVVALVLFLTVIAPVLIVLFEMLAGVIDQRLRQGLHLLVIATLVTCTVLPPLKHAHGISGVSVVSAAVGIGLAGAIIYRQWSPLRTMLTVLAPAPIVFAALFLFDPRVSNVVLHAEAMPRLSHPINGGAPLVMVVFDEFDVATLMNEDRLIDRVRYPHFADLASGSTWFRNATAVHPHTAEAVPAILTGRYTRRAELPIAADHPDNLFTWLAAGYSMNVTEPLTRLCPKALCGLTSLGDLPLSRRLSTLGGDLAILYAHVILPPSLAARLPPVTQGWGGFANQSAKQAAWIDWLNGRVTSARENDRFSAFTAFLGRITDAPGSTLNFLHVLLPHVPYEYLASGQRYNTPDRLLGLIDERWTDDEPVVAQAFERYRLQVGFVDLLIGRLLDRLRAIGLYDRAMIVIVADHGVCFRPGDLRREMSDTNAACIASVPLFIKAPGQSVGTISERNVQTIDIVPTIADVLDLDLPWKPDGASAFDSSIPERTEKVIVDDSHRYVFGPRLEDNKAQPAASIDDHGLVGRSEDEFGTIAASGGSIELDQGSLLDDVDPSGAFVPAHVSGRVRLGSQPGRPLQIAVGVNGRIAAVASSLPGNAAGREFSAVVPAAAFQRGHNRVEVFIVSGVSGQPRLARIEAPLSMGYTLTSNEQGEGIRSRTGQVIPVVPEVMDGNVDIASQVEHRLRFSGWAADTKRGELPSAILVFDHNTLVGSGRADIQRLDVATLFDKPAIGGCGFTIEIPADRIANLERPDIRLFSVSTRGVASELSYPKTYRWRF